MCETDTEDCFSINTLCPSCNESIDLVLFRNTELEDTIFTGVRGVYAYRGNIKCTNCGQVVLCSFTVMAPEGIICA